MPSRRPIVIAYHLVWTAYGTWLPNDPRGSGSRSVATPQLAELGPLHYGRRKMQPAPQIVREFYGRADERLKFPVIRVDARQIDEIGHAFSESIAAEKYTCYACAILQDHVHLVIRKHKHRAEEMIENFQSATRSRLIDIGSVPTDHPVWTLGGWRRFLDNPSAVHTVIRYVAQNRTKCALKPQSWPFLTPYDNWTFSRGFQS
jgi:REP element-mobilizing transposase RayT